MQKVINIIGCMLFVICSMSCRQKMHAAEYVAYVSDKKNGLSKVVEVDGWQFCMQYRPSDLIMLAENRGHMDAARVSKRKAELQGAVWFNISIKRADNSISMMRYGISSPEEYNSRLNYYLNEAMSDIRLVYGKDTLQPSSYLFENNYNLSPQETMVVGFQLPAGEDHAQKDMRLSYIDRIFKNGIINAEYSGKTLNNIPVLVY